MSLDLGPFLRSPISNPPKKLNPAGTLPSHMPLDTDMPRHITAMLQNLTRRPYGGFVLPGFQNQCIRNTTLPQIIFLSTRK